MDVPELGREDRVGPEEIDFAGPGVTRSYLINAEGRI
jgi:hypothetical protein